MNQASVLSAPAPARFLTPQELMASFPEARPQSAPRRLGPQQGIALELLGHAIEYLIDSNFYHQRENDPAIQEAINILKQSSRTVFETAPIVIPARARAARWLRSRFQAQATADAVIEPVCRARLVLVKR